MTVIWLLPLGRTVAESLQLFAVFVVTDRWIQAGQQTYTVI